MASSLQQQQKLQQNDNDNDDDINNIVLQETKKLYKTYIGVSFAVFLTLLPPNATSLLTTFRSRNHYLLHRLRKAEEELFELRSRRQEDSKANARVVEIFATHRNAWQQEERRLLRRLDESAEEISRLRTRLAELEAQQGQLLSEADELRREVGERDELLNFMSRHKSSEIGERESESEQEGCEINGGGGNNLMFGQLGCDYNNDDGFDPNFLSSSATSKFWGESRPPNLWQVWIHTLFIFWKFISILVQFSLFVWIC